MPGAVWRRPANAWLLDGLVVQLDQPPLPELVRMVLVSERSPAKLVLATARDQRAVARICTGILDRDSPVDQELLHEVADQIVDTWFGMSRWVVERIWAEAIAGWRELDGDLGSHGVDVLALPPDRATNVLYWALRARHSGEQPVLERWLHALEKPPDRVITDAAVDAEDAAAGWFAFAAQAAEAGMPNATAGIDSELIVT